MADKKQTMQKSASTDLVTVACKLPCGLELREHRKSERVEQGPAGQLHRFDQFLPTGKSIQIRGTAVPHGVQLAAAVAGFALTRNVPAPFWELWLEQNQDHDAVRNGLVWAFPQKDRDAIEGKADEMKGVLTGLEPLDVSLVTRKVQGRSREVMADPRVPKNDRRVIVEEDTTARSEA